MAQVDKTVHWTEKPYQKRPAGMAVLAVVVGSTTLCACRAATQQKAEINGRAVVSPAPLADAAVTAPEPATAEADAASPPPHFLEDGAERVFKGTLGKGVRIVVRLARAGQDLRGRYFYESKGIDLVLRGTIAPDGAIELDETADANKKSGHFAGNLDEEGNFNGTWTNAKGKRPLPFRLTSAPPAETASAPLPLYKKYVHFTKKPKTKDPTGLLKACTLDAEYPEIDGALDPMLETKLNDLLRPKSARGELECDTPETNDVKYNVSLNQAGIVSVVFEAEWCCGAYPSFDREFVNVSAVTGERITLTRLLLPDARPKLVGFLLPAVQITAHQIELDKTSDVLEQLTEKPAEFSIEPGGLRFSAFNSQPHVIQSAFAEGYFLPFSRLAPLFRQPGPLDALLRD